MPLPNVLHLPNVLTHHPSRVAFRDYLATLPGGEAHLLDFYFEAQRFGERAVNAPLGARSSEPARLQAAAREVLDQYADTPCAELAQALKRAGLPRAVRSEQKCHARMMAPAQQAVLLLLRPLYADGFVASDGYKRLLELLALRLAAHAGLSVDFATRDTAAQASSALGIHGAAAGPGASSGAGPRGRGGVVLVAALGRHRKSVSVSVSAMGPAGPATGLFAGVKSSVRSGDRGLARDAVTRRLRSLSRADSGRGPGLVRPAAAAASAAAAKPAAARPAAPAPAMVEPPPQMAFRDLLYNPLGIEMLTDYMRKEFNEENLEFHMAVRRYRRRVHATEEARYADAAALLERFLCSTSPEEINVSAALRRQVKESLGRGASRTMFDNVSVAVTKTIRADVYARYVASPTHAAHLDELRAVVLAASHAATVQRRKNLGAAVHLIQSVPESDEEEDAEEPSASRAGGEAGGEAAARRGGGRRWRMRRTPSDSGINGGMAAWRRDADSRMPTLREALADPQLLAAFIAASSGEFSEELPLFWCAADEYRMGWQRRDDIANLLALARAIRARYVQADAEYAIHAPLKDRNAIDQAIREHTCGSDLYASLQEYAFHLMEVDTYPRFLRSDEFAAVMSAPPALHEPQRVDNVSNAPAHLYPRTRGATANVL